MQSFFTQTGRKGMDLILVKELFIKENPPNIGGGGFFNNYSFYLPMGL